MKIWLWHLWRIVRYSEIQRPHFEINRSSPILPQRRGSLWHQEDRIANLISPWTRKNSKMTIRWEYDKAQYVWCDLKDVKISHRNFALCAPAPHWTEEVIKRVFPSTCECHYFIWALFIAVFWAIWTMLKVSKLNEQNATKLPKFDKNSWKWGVSNSPVLHFEV